MNRNKILEKLLAMMLIFTLTFANFALVTKSYAASFAEVVFGVGSDTGSRNVSFDAYFEVEGERGTSIISDVNNKDLFINTSLNVKKEGYLENAKVEIVGANDEELNFDIREEISEESETLQENQETIPENQEAVPENQESQVDSENQNENPTEAQETLTAEEIKEMVNGLLSTPEQSEETAQSGEPAEQLRLNSEEQITQPNQEEELQTQDEQQVSSEEQANTNQEVVEEQTNQEQEVNQELVDEEQTEEKEEKVTVEELVEEQEYVEGFEDNTLYFSQIKKDSEILLRIPIEYKNEEFIREEKASGESIVRFSGTYVDKDGDETEVAKEVSLEVLWKDEREAKLEEEKTKYVTYEGGLIFQTVEKIDSKVEEGENTLPVKETELEIDVPIIKDQKPTKITVVANSTEGTNGLEAGEVKFGEDNWEYNEEENKLRIKVNNEKQMVEVSETEGEYLQEGEKKEEERLYNGSGVDEYVVTYTYGNLEVGEEEKLEAKTKAVARMTTLSGVEAEENKNVVTDEKENTYELEGTTGEIVSLHINNNNKEEMSKAYAYVNYNNPGRYETEMPSEMIINISYKDIVEGMEVKDETTTYVDKAGNVIETNDVYYKTIRVSKENFDKILGEAGEIKVKDEAGNIINVINKDSEVNEAGNIEIGFGERYSKLNFEITKPAEEGNLVISTVKAVSDVTVDKPTYANLDRIVTKSRMEARYSYVEEPVNIGEVSAETKLIDTVTEANLILDRESLSTIEPNTDVEMRVELNNAKESSDVYGHSDFEIELPEYVENIDLTNVNLLYGEGLQLTGSSVEGRIIRFSIDGRQDGINSGVLTNGTNIVMNANINVNMYAPAKEEKVVLRYANSEATNYYANGTVKEVGIEYSAPTGLVAVNSISNYDDQGTVTTSIRQGKKEGKIAIYGGPIIARTELIIMNNNRNNVSNINILGRIPFKGVKDLVSNEELKTTLNSNITGLIESNEQNRGIFNIYYSENGEATRDLEDENNGWTLEPADLNVVKSYLIVPTEDNYEMAENEILRFAYNFAIPENLPHNEYAYGTFGVYYRNNAEVARSNEFEVADIVGLTTGVGPELEATISKDVEKVKEKEEFAVTISVSNIGETVAENVNIEVPMPNGGTYSRYEIDVDNATISEAPDKFVATLDKMEIGQNVQLKVYLIANPLVKTEGSTTITKTVVPTVNVTAKDLETVLTRSTDEIEIEFAEFYVEEVEMDEEKIERAGNEISFRTTVINSSTETKNNVIIKKILPKELSIVSATEGYDFDETTREITWKIESMKELSTQNFYIDTLINSYDENIAIKEISISTSVKAENSEEYNSNKIIVKIGKPILKIIQTSDNANTYLKEGDSVNYTFIIKNEGGVIARNLQIKDYIPEEVAITSVSYVVKGKEINETGFFNREINLEVNIPIGEDWFLKLSGEAKSIKGADEKSATNYAVLSSEEIEELTSNSITHIIEGSNNNDYNEDGISKPSSNNGSKQLQSKTYKISGTAWEDKNKDGMKGSDESGVSKVKAKLVNSETGEVLKSATTDSQGKYTFSGVANGNYLVLFEYDTTKYKVTTYKKEGVAENSNSDVISTTIESGGKTKEGAVTDVITINNGSVSDINLGLMLSKVFDLKLEKYISKVMVQTSNGTTTEEYNNVALAKTDIGSKYLSGATVFVEYTIVVSNVGDYAGYAKKIVDYVPEGMVFNSTLEANKEWYTGSDGNLYTDSLQNKELKPGSTQTIKLVLTKQTTEENIGIMSNMAEIYEDYNTYGVKDINSTPGNKIQSENDMGKADMVIGVRTGEVFVYISIIIMTILLGSIAVFVVYSRIAITRGK